MEKKNEHLKNALFNLVKMCLRLSQNIPVHPFSHLHSKGFVQDPWIQPGKGMQDKHNSPGREEEEE